MRITQIETIPYAISYTYPLKFASGEVHTADHVLVRIHTEDGLVGIADVPPRPYTYGETRASVVSVINDIFAPQLLGMKVHDRQKAWQVMNRTVHNETAKGAIDIALWDLIGKAAGLPVHTLLGGYTDRLRVSHMLGFRPADELLREAQRCLEHYGIATFKLKTGQRPIDADVEAARVLCEGLPRGVEIYVDANRGWSANEAMDFLRRTADLPITLLEEPNDAKEAMGRRRLVSQSPIPVVGDESVPTPGDVSRELLSGGCTAVCIKTARSGFTQAQTILGLCEGLGVDVTMGNQIDTQIGTMATITFGAAHEATSRRAAELSNYLDMSDDLIATPLQIRDGAIAAPTVPGVGVEIDEAKLERYRLDKSPANQIL